jgi:hypothetical protein
MLKSSLRTLNPVVLFVAGAVLVGSNTTVTAQMPPLPPSPMAKSLSTSVIESKLNHLSHWVNVSEFRSYLILLPHQIDIKNNVAAQGAGVAVNQLFHFAPYTLTSPSMALTLMRSDHPVPNGWSPAAAASFQLTAEHLFDAAHGGDPNDAICLVLDGFNTPVYIPVAEQFEAGFIEGLVTRLVLGQYARAWKQQDASLLNFTASANQPKVKDIVHLVPYYPQGAPIPAGAVAFAPMPAPVASSLSFNEWLSERSQFDPIEPAAIMWGWRAGEKLDGMLGGADESYRDDVVTLIESRFSPREIGALTGYTLNYLYGFVKNDRVASFALSGPQPPITNNSSIVDSLAKDKNIVGARQLISDFHNTLVLELYGITQSNTPNHQRDLGVQMAFLSGFEAGSLEASDEIYHSVFNMAYHLGYQSGWRFGYEQGYAAGFVVGYDQGYGQAWTQASTMIQGLQSTVANASNPGGGGGISFNDVVTGISVIASLFA